MQVMPATGKELKVGDITSTRAEHPRRRQVRALHDGSLLRRARADASSTKGLFTFASYNAGPARIRTCARARQSAGSIPTSGSTTSRSSPPSRSGGRRCSTSPTSTSTTWPTRSAELARSAQGDATTRDMSAAANAGPQLAADERHMTDHETSSSRSGALSRTPCMRAASCDRRDRRARPGAAQESRAATIARRKPKRRQASGPVRRPAGSKRRSSRRSTCSRCRRTASIPFRQRLQRRRIHARRRLPAFVERTQRTVNFTGLYSSNNYKLFEVGVQRPRHVPAAHDARAHAGWRDATQVAYHGLGIDSPEDRTEYRMKQGYAGAEVTSRPQPWAIFKGGAHLRGLHVVGGSGSIPSIEEVHTPATAPGLGANPDYLHVNGVGGNRHAPRRPATRGGACSTRSAYHDYDDRDDTYTLRSRWTPISSTTSRSCARTG